MRCGCKSVFLVALILFDLGAVAGAILNLLWNTEEAEIRMWLGWVMLAVDSVAFILSILVGIFHWIRLGRKRHDDTPLTNFSHLPDANTTSSSTLAGNDIIWDAETDFL